MFRSFAFAVARFWVAQRFSAAIEMPISLAASQAAEKVRKVSATVEEPPFRAA